MDRGIWRALEEACIESRRLVEVYICENKGNILIILSIFVSQIEAYNNDNKSDLLITATVKNQNY